MRRPRSGGRRLAGLLLVLALLPGAAHGQGALSALQTDVDLIASRARPSVVTVYARRVQQPDRGRGRPLEPRVRTRVGSGVAVGESIILTTASVVLSADRVFIETANGLQVEAQIGGVDAVYNVALLRVPDLRLPTLSFAAGRPPQIGDWVIALGTTYRGQPTQTVGNVVYRHREPHFSLLQLTNMVYPGNSGGAALNTRGELIGIVQGDLGMPTLVSSADGGGRPAGASFILPAEVIRPVYESLLASGRLPHGWLGVTARAGVVESESEAGVQVPIGALVESVVAGGPADRLGIRRGDLIVAFERNRVEYPEQLARWVAGTRPGKTVDLVWVHDDLQRTGQAMLTESREVLPAWALSDRAGGGGSPARMADLERQIHRLNRELKLLKGQGAAAPR